MIKVGLTGGIGSGKSLACEIFESLGVPVIDADKISHRLTAPGSPCTEAIRRAFGERVITAEGALRRDVLRRVVFADDADRKRLEDILHPAIKERIQTTLSALRVPYCVVSVPLLVESDFGDLVDMTVVLDCPEHLQVKRTRQRSGLSHAETLAIIDKQAPRKQRLAAADVVIDNRGGKNALKEQLESLHVTLLRKAAGESTR